MNTNIEKKYVSWVLYTFFFYMFCIRAAENFSIKERKMKKNFTLVHACGGKIFAK